MDSLQSIAKKEKSNRVGRFSLNHETLLRREESPYKEALAAVFAKCIIIRAEAMFSTRTIEYEAYCDDFDDCEQYTTPPLYHWQMHCKKDGTFSHAHVKRADGKDIVPKLPALLEL